MNAPQQVDLHPEPVHGPPAPRHQRRRSRQYTSAKKDRSVPCGNRNGFWPPLYQRQFDPLPYRSLDNQAQKRYSGIVHDAMRSGELHRTTGAVLLAFHRHSSDNLQDVYVAQATVGDLLDLTEDCVNGHVAILKALGWMQVQHRNKVVNGMRQAMSNITRLTLPAHWQAVDAARKKAGEEKAARNAKTRRARQRRAREGHGAPAGTFPFATDGEDGRPPQPPPIVLEEPPPLPTREERAQGVAARWWAQFGDLDRCRSVMAGRYQGEPELLALALAALEQLAGDPGG